ncbi:MAG: hypothetical protein ACM3QS_04665, partial [Bacteroidota bacterium]
RPALQKQTFSLSFASLLWIDERRSDPGAGFKREATSLREFAFASRLRAHHFHEWGEVAVQPNSCKSVLEAGL